MSESSEPGSSATAMFGALPADVVERTPRSPFAPPSGLVARRGAGPVGELTLRNGAPAWLVTGFDEARAVLADPRFSNDRVRHPDATVLTAAQLDAPPPPPPPPPGERGDGMFIFMDPPEHTRLRGLLVGQFTVRRMRALEERLTEIAAEHVDAMRAAGSPADLVPAYALPLPSIMICELLGVDYADRATFQRTMAVAMSSASAPEEKARAGAELHAFVSGLVAAKRARRGDDLLSGLIHDADPPLADTQLVDMALVLLGAGHETTANQLALSTFALLENPGQLAALREDPSLVDAAVEELLRFLAIIQLGVSRVATADVDLAGTTIPAGATVILAGPEINRDPRHWDAPDTLDVHRDRTPHLAFGHGIHQCLGQQLARIEMRVGLTELVTRLPGLRLAVPADEVPLRNDMLIYGVHSLPVAWV